MEFANSSGLVAIAGWTTVAALVALLVIQTRNLHRFTTPKRSELADWPSVSILVPARNEEQNIRECVQSLLAQDYPGEIEILVLDDGSTDSTAEIVRQLTVVSDRLRLLTGEELPDGWKGKNWACHQLAAEAKGELLLFTDADTRHDPATLSRAVSSSLTEEADLLSLMPEQQTGTLAEKLTLPLLNFFYATFFPAFVLEDNEDPRFHAANGQFLLFRRSAYEAIGGHESICGSVVDDLALAKRIRQERLRLRVLNGAGLVTTRMYRGASEIVSGFSKNLYAAIGGSAGRAIAISLLLIALFVAPLVMLVAMREFSWLLATIVGIWMRLRVDVRSRSELGYGFLHPLSIVIAVALLIRSTTLGIRNEAVDWKGRKV